MALDEGAARLGEVALVDREGRIGPLDTVFYDTLLDENAASHIALGNAYAFCAEDEDKPRLNTSEIHIDFMIGVQRGRGHRRDRRRRAGPGAARRQLAAELAAAGGRAARPRRYACRRPSRRGAGVVERARLEIA